MTKTQTYITFSTRAFEPGFFKGKEFLNAFNKNKGNKLNKVTVEPEVGNIGFVINFIFDK